MTPAPLLNTQYNRNEYVMKYILLFTVLRSQASELTEAWFYENIDCEIELIYFTCPHGATHTMQMLCFNTSKHQATHMHYPAPLGFLIPYRNDS